VQALLFDIPQRFAAVGTWNLMSLYDRPICIGEECLFAGCRSAVIHPFIVVHLFTGNDTTAAPYTLCQINQYALCIFQISM
jgi:hypothetical protein